MHYRLYQIMLALVVGGSQWFFARVSSHFVSSHFVNSHLVNVDKVGIDEVGIKIYNFVYF